MVHASRASRLGERSRGRRCQPGRKWKMQDDLPARIRAARAYAKLGVRECAHALGISEDTFERTEKGKRPLTIPEAKAYADATGVPLWFLLDGWPGSLRQIDERLNELQRLLAGELG